MTQQLIDREAVLLLTEACDRLESATETEGLLEPEWSSDDRKFCLKVRAYLAALPVETAQAISEELLNFLYGSGPLDGVWFGESHPTESGAFWWRKYLPLLRAPQQATSEEREERNQWPCVVCDAKEWPGCGCDPAKVCAAADSMLQQQARLLRAQPD